MTKKKRFKTSTPEVRRPLLEPGREGKAKRPQSGNKIDEIFGKSDKGENVASRQGTLIEGGRLYTVDLLIKIACYETKIITFLIYKAADLN
jgi:hypothetical protein